MAFLKTVLTWLICFLVASIGGFFYVFFRATGRIKIQGQEHIKEIKMVGMRNILLVANHPSRLDAVLIPFAAFWPRLIINPIKYIPYQIPGEDSFVYRMPFFLHLIEFLKCIPINSAEPNKRLNMVNLRKAIRVLNRGTVLIFPEGISTSKAKRIFCYTTHGTIGQPLEGVGILAEKTKPIILPIFVRNTEKVFSREMKMPRFFASQVTVIFGKPFRLTPSTNEFPPQERYSIYAAQIMRRIAALDA